MPPMPARIHAVQSNRLELQHQDNAGLIVQTTLVVAKKKDLALIPEAQDPNFAALEIRGDLLVFVRVVW